MAIRKLHWRINGEPDALCRRNGSTVDFATNIHTTTCASCLNRIGTCDGCDNPKPTVQLKASDDGRGIFCPTCLPVANAPTPEETVAAAIREDESLPLPDDRDLTAILNEFPTISPQQFIDAIDGVLSTLGMITSSRPEFDNSAPFTVIRRTGPRPRKPVRTRAERAALGTRKNRRAYTKNPGFRDRATNIFHKTHVAAPPHSDSNVIPFATGTRR